jgi:hypothetical protein
MELSKSAIQLASFLTGSQNIYYRPNGKSVYAEPIRLIVAYFSARLLNLTL